MQFEMEFESEENLPVLLGYAFTGPRTGIRLIAAWCPFCRKWHEHGLIDDEVVSKTIHRSPHCPPASPFYHTGYMIKLVPGDPPEVMVEARDWYGYNRSPDEQVVEFDENDDDDDDDDDDFELDDVAIEEIVGHIREARGE